MRVYLLTPSFPPTLGGQEKHLLELAAALIHSGADTRVLTRRAPAGAAAREQLGVVPVRRFAPSGAIKGVGLIAAPRLALLLAQMTWQLWRDRHRYDVVLVSGFNITPFAAVLAGLFTRKPCVVRPESPLEMEAGIGPEARQKMRLGVTALPLRLFERLRSASARRIDSYVAISAEIRARLTRVGIDATRIASIPNGIDIGRYASVEPAAKASLRRELRLPERALVVVYTGRLAVSKGMPMLIEAWASLAATHPNAHLVLVGSGAGCFDDCEPELAAFVSRHELSARVTMTGAVANVEQYLQASDVFAFPSDYEGFSLSILESMTAGLPMVCTRVGVAAELEQQCAEPIGLVVAPKDAAGFRAALAQLLDDEPLRRTLGAAARAAVQAEYSLETEARRYRELFAGLAAGVA